MMLNRNFKDFKFQHKRNKNQIIYATKKIKDDSEILNLIDNFLEEKNSFIFESVEKGKIRGRYTIFGKNPDKIWEFDNNNSYLIKGKTKKKIKGKPKKIIEKIIEEFKFETPSNLPPICSLISGYFSYDAIRYIEKISDNCTDDLKLPDVRLLRPRTLIIHDNIKKKIFYIMNIFKIKSKINKTVDEIIKFNPDILFSVDSPDFTLRVAEKVKVINDKIKTIHYVAPQVWIWREGRVKNFKKFLDHILLLFSFEKKYFDKENIPNTFVGHPLLEENKKSKIDLSSLINKDKKIISIFAGSRKSETNVLLPILSDFIKLMNKQFNDYTFIFHATNENKDIIISFLKNNSLDNSQVISDENIKFQILSSSMFAVAKSGTVSLEICNANVPSIIIYKINMINYLIMKLLVKVKFANIINIINNKEIIPELLQSECNAKEIYKSVVYFLKNPELMKDQVNNCNKTLNEIRSKSVSSLEASLVLSKHLTS